LPVISITLHYRQVECAAMSVLPNLKEGRGIMITFNG
jgi:hypothetical protein